MRSVALSGSLQERSSNAALLDAARSLAPDDMTVVISDAVRRVPLFNPDLDQPPQPVAVERFRREVGTADAVLIANPEYAFGVPGALKNALDWLVRSGELYAKPVAIIAGSPRENGGIHARGDLERTLGAQGATVVSSVTIQVPRRDEQPDVEFDTDIRQSIARLLRDLELNLAEPQRDGSGP
jgi:chromate reductase, NAD(P)H dehydrogenase (quinone)